jgi:hypothetical protein
MVVAAGGIYDGKGYFFIYTYFFVSFDLPFISHAANLINKKIFKNSIVTF